MSAQGQGLDIDDDDDTIPPIATAIPSQSRPSQSAGNDGISGRGGNGGTGGGSGGSGGSVNPNDHWHEELPCDCSLSTMVNVLLNQVFDGLTD